MGIWVVLDDASEWKVVLDRSMTMESFILVGSTALVFMDKNELVDIIGDSSG